LPLQFIACKINLKQMTIVRTRCLIEPIINCVLKVSSFSNMRSRYANYKCTGSRLSSTQDLVYKSAVRHMSARSSCIVIILFYIDYFLQQVFSLISFGLICLGSVYLPLVNRFTFEVPHYMRPTHYLLYW
jgi:hypothetical protein